MTFCTVVARSAENLRSRGSAVMKKRAKSARCWEVNSGFLLTRCTSGRKLALRAKSARCWEVNSSCGGQAAPCRVVPPPPRLSHLCRPCEKRVVHPAEGRRSAAAAGRPEAFYGLQVLPRVHAMISLFTQQCVSLFNFNVTRLSVTLRTTLLQPPTGYRGTSHWGGVLLGIKVRA